MTVHHEISFRPKHCAEEYDAICKHCCYGEAEYRAWHSMGTGALGKGFLGLLRGHRSQCSMCQMRFLPPILLNSNVYILALPS